MKSLSLLSLASIASISHALGINCRGSGLCPFNNGLLGTAQAQLKGMDQAAEFTDGQHITCLQSSVTIGDPSLCIFYQNTSGRKFTVAQAVASVQGLLDHGCKVCGSNPTDEGNNVANGQLTANMVAAGNVRRRASAHTRRELEKDARAAAAAERSTTITPKTRSTTSKNPLNARALGINCRGSSNCGIGGIFGTEGASLSDVRDAVAAGPEGVFANGQQIACQPHAFGRLCAFYQNIGDRTFDKAQSVAFLDNLLAHKCGNCGSIPTDDGNDTSKGQLTVNFVS